MSQFITESTQNVAARKVVFVEDAAAMGGVQFSTLYVAQQLDPANWKPIVVCSEEGDFTSCCRRAGLETHVLEQPKLRSTSFRIAKDIRLPNPLAWLWDAATVLVASRRLARFLSEIKPQLVVTKGLFPHIYGGLATRQTGIPCVWHVQDFVSERFFGLYRRAFALVAALLPKHIIADGGAIKRQLHSLEHRVSVILNGVDTNVFQPRIDGRGVRRELGIPEDAVVIGHVGRMTPWKGQHYLLEAFARIANEVSNAYVVFIGDPVFDTDSYQNKLLELTKKLDLTKRVKFAGYRHDMPEVLASMDLFAFTSVEKDTSPLTLLSAMSAGLPIVAFDIEGVRELVDAKEQMLRVPVADSKSLADSILRLLNDKELQQRLSIAARTQAENNFSLQHHVKAVEAVFLNTVQSRSVMKEMQPSLIDQTLASSQTVAKHSIRP